MSSSTQQPSKFLHILVVDDDPDILLMLKDRLKFLGFNVSVATNGEEGLEKLEKTAFDGILLDIQMPVMDGVTMLTHIYQRYPRIPVLVMSATRNVEQLIEAMEWGARDYLFKPIDLEVLSKKCHENF